MKVQFRFDASGKKHVGNKPYYFWKENNEGKFQCTAYMTEKQAYTFKRQLENLGIEVEDRVN